jgi:hypothetical protein
MLGNRTQAGETPPGGYWSDLPESEEPLPAVVRHYLKQTPDFV